MEADMSKGKRRWGQSASDRHAPRHADEEISRLEHILAGGAWSFFAQIYWRRRLHELYAMPGLGFPQRARLEELLTALERHEKQYR
jgi:hypothetical protein